MVQIVMDFSSHGGEGCACDFHTVFNVIAHVIVIVVIVVFCANSCVCIQSIRARLSARLDIQETTSGWC